MKRIDVKVETLEEVISSPKSDVLMKNTEYSDDIFSWLIFLPSVV